MLLSDASLFMIVKFLQILLWISIPALLIATLITTLVHYSRKKRKNKEGDQLWLFNENAENDGEQVQLYPVVNIPGSKQEVKSLLYHLSRSNARYIAMRKDFETLTKKYQQLHTYVHKDFETINKETMEAGQTDLQQGWQQQVENIKYQHEIEKKELYAELTQLTASFENLEKENFRMRDQLKAFTEGNAAATIIQSLEDEKAELKQQLGEQNYLKDVLEEKRLQINFLQQQLEQRIKNHHLVEQQFRELGIKLMEAREQLEIKQQESKELHNSVHDKEQEITFLKEVMQSKAESEAQMETIIKDLKEENSRYSFQAEDKENVISNLNDQLTESNNQKKELEDRLEKNQTLFKSFHKKLSVILEEEMPPVIVMRQVYKGEEMTGQITESVIQ